MQTKTKKRSLKNPEIIYRDNKPVSVIIDIKEYKEILERLEDLDDRKYIKKLNKDSLSFRKLDDFLVEHNSNV